MRTRVVVASLAIHATIFAAAAAPSPARSPVASPPSTAPAEADVTIDTLVSPDPPALLESPPSFPAGNGAAAHVSRAAVLTPHRVSEDVRPASRAAGSLAPPAQVAALAQTTDDEPRFTIAIGAASTAASVSAPAAGIASKNQDESPLPEEGVSSPARLVQGAAPPYPDGARRERIQADVPLEIVVSSAGVVEAARPLSHPGHGLDDAAVAAVQRYRFRPAAKDGHPVGVRMRWIMQFRLW